MLKSLREMHRKMVSELLAPEAVAGGWALGMFVGCAVPFGLQLIVSVPLALMMRVSKVGATLGTFITNPVTIFFIYPAQTMMTGWLLRRPFTWESVSVAMRGVAEKGEWSALFALSSDLIVCFLLGGLLFALILSPLTYLAVKRLVVRHRRRMSRQPTGREC